ncbi:arsenate reductase [Verrucomicrobium sp. GAS474]|uniref:arsenate reductase ArsC n=1 Tax=Verrucomicrobium sp. GAS474 TaxID=1882831 RepID=UPI00087D982B|nr:arsenate reductase ArsC [Verrucomicrobium sp. GAS474]SDT91001.1 arsenate reductase [Verrucomicrobium sp. GAS474]
MDTSKPFKILFLCTGNTARSVFGEFLIKRIGQGRFESYSAGANPKGKVNPYTLRVLSEIYKIDASSARSKGWDEFRNVHFDFVITVCDNARESCPVWPGQPIIAHWGSPDPASFVGTEDEILANFTKVAFQIQRRIELLCCLPFEKLDRLRLVELTKDIGSKETLNSTMPT